MKSENQFKVIFHIDMNAFFASCEIAEDPKLVGKPVVVAHNDPFRRSIILTASYEARKYGIKTTMLTKEAIKLCPSVIIVEPKHELYQKYSKLFFEYMYTITKKYEIMSIDEGFFDMTEICMKYNPLQVAKRIQDNLLNKYKLPCSIGIAPNKFLAKMASDMKKPLGITILRKREIDKYLWPLPIEDMIGVGKKTAPRLHEIGIHTIGDAANFKDNDLLEKTVGSAMANYLYQRANGNDSNLVQQPSSDDFSSVSNSQTFDYDVNSVIIIKDLLKNLCNSVCNRLEKHNSAAKTFGIQIKYNNFQLINRSQGLDVALNDSFDVWPIIEGLFDDNYDENRYVRLVGVFANRIEKKNQVIKQYSLFDDLSKIEKENDVKKLLNKLNKQLGDNIIGIGLDKIKKEEKPSDMKVRFMREEDNNVR